MTNPTTKADELAALVERATPGPWITHSAKYPLAIKADIFLPDAKSVADATHIARMFLPAPYQPPIDALHAMAQQNELAPAAEANAAFIVWCRNNADLLIEALKRMGADQ